MNHNNPPVADGTLRRLACLIEGEPSVFSVKPTGSMDIMDLKELIREKAIEAIEPAILTKNLTLWKVRMTMASDNTTNSPAG